MVKFNIAAIAFVLAGSAASPVEANAAPLPALTDAEARQLAQRSNCFSCHAIDRKAAGPAWKDVAAKYRGDADAEARLVAKVSRGGAGVWGSRPMPPFAPTVTETDIRALVKYILSLK